jgi:DHA1 family bicyclomycin/chloramphenicol resistance-like MFS transporter
MGLFGMGLGAFPAIGPLLGGYIHVWAGWRANFVLMAVAIFVFGLVAIKVLPETKTPDRNALNLRHIARTYASLLCDRAILRYLIPMGTSMAGLFAFITAGPFILIERMGVATEDYGLYSGATVIAYILGSFAVSRLAGKVAAVSMVNAGLITLFAGGVGIIALVSADWAAPLTLVAVLSISTFGIGLVFGAAPMLLLDVAGDARRGMASGLLGFFELGCAALGALAVGVFYDGTVMPFALVMGVSATLGLLIWWGLGERRS